MNLVNYFVKFRNVIITTNFVCVFYNLIMKKSINLAKIYNKKIVVRIFTFRVDNFSHICIIVVVPSKTTSGRYAGFVHRFQVGYSF